MIKITEEFRDEPWSQRASGTLFARINIKCMLGILVGAGKSCVHIAIHPVMTNDTLLANG